MRDVRETKAPSDEPAINRLSNAVYDRQPRSSR
jgi:hypothetical protein